MDMEDPVVFLKQIQESCPIVLSLLDTKQVNLISRSPTEAYDLKDVNDEYLMDMRCHMDIQQRIEDAEQNLRSTLLIPRKIDKDVDVGTFKKQTEVLKMVSPGTPFSHCNLIGHTNLNVSFSSPHASVSIYRICLHYCLETPATPLFC